MVMAKAQVVTKAGTKITVEGTPEEVAALIERFDSSVHPEKMIAESTPARRSQSKIGPQDRIHAMIESGFFRRPQGLGAIRAALEEQGHFYPVTTLSPVLLRLVRGRSLRRLKDNNVWSYVQP
jgi:hypothetical protein